ARPWGQDSSRRARTPHTAYLVGLAAPADEVPIPNVPGVLSVARRSICLICPANGQGSTDNRRGWPVLGSLVGSIGLAAALLLGGAGVGKLRAPQPAATMLRRAL